MTCVDPAPPAHTSVPVDAASVPASELSLDDVIEAWPVVLAALNRPVAAAITDAQPIAVEDGVIVFGVPRAAPRRDPVALSG